MMASTYSARPMLQTIELRSNGDEWFMVATDSYVLAVMHGRFDGEYAYGMEAHELFDAAHNADVLGLISRDVVEAMRKTPGNYTSRLTSPNVIHRGNWRLRGEPDRFDGEFPNWGFTAKGPTPSGIEGALVLGPATIGRIAGLIRGPANLRILGQQPGRNKPVFWEIQHLHMVGIAMPVRDE